ncbi:MAG TPA: response regulator [Thermoanaerobaculia bacterium]|nr:response regulator [Thermoanaerobaculia bacterium]
MHILLIDDEVGVLTNLGIYLRVERHTSAEIRRIADKEHLHRQLEAIRPHAVILDFGMGHDGDTVYSWIREWNHDIPIVFYTCYAESPAHHARMRSAGAKDREIIAKREVGTDLRDLLAVLA